MSRCFNPLKHKNIFKKLKKNVKQVKKKNGLNNSVILVKFKSRTYFEIFLLYFSLFVSHLSEFDTQTLS